MIKEGDIMPRTKLNRELIKMAAQLIESGNYITDVCKALRVSREAFYAWLRKGEKAEEGLEKELYDAIKEAEGRAIARNVALIQKAAQNGNWQAAAWWLERKYPKEWGRKDKFDFGGQGEIKIKIERVKTTDTKKGKKNE